MGVLVVQWLAHVPFTSVTRVNRFLLSTVIRLKFHLGHMWEARFMSLPKESKWLTYFCILFCIIYMHLLLFLWHDWLIFCHMIISNKFIINNKNKLINSLFPVSPWRRANARNVGLYYPYRQYTNICISTLPTQHTTFISLLVCT